MPHRYARVLTFACALALAVAALACASGCRTLGDADVAMIQTHLAANAGHVADPALPPEAVAIAEANYDGWAVLLYSATGDPPPAEVQERIAARRRVDGAPAPEAGLPRQ